MADDTSASIITLHQPQTKRPKSAAERARAYRERQRAAKSSGYPEHLPVVVTTNALSEITDSGSEIAEHPQSKSAYGAAPFRHQPAPVFLQLAALCLAVVGMTMNGWFARSLGSTDTAGYLFLAVGMAADVAALCLPSVASCAWTTRQRVTAAAGWCVWLATFVFAVTAGIGFASLNISDVTAARASRSNPAVTTANAALADAMAARDRECRGGVGRFCRDREAAVVERRQALDVAMHQIEATADPQSEAAIKLVAWVSRGAVRPAADDFAMLRLCLLALLPQIGGILLMVGKAK